MRLKNLILGLALFLVASLASADNCFRVPCEKADLPTCVAKLKGREFMVKNCVSLTSCATTDNPGFAVAMVCDYDGSEEEWLYRPVNYVADETVPVDTSLFAMLGGRESGQTINGYTGSNKPRLALLNTEMGLYGDAVDGPRIIFSGQAASFNTYNGLGQSMGINLTPNYISLDADGLTSVFSIFSGGIRFGLPLVFPSGASPPTCDSALVAGPESKALYIDNTTGAGTLCSCNGSSWSVIAPSGGSCG